MVGRGLMSDVTAGCVKNAKNNSRKNLRTTNCTYEIYKVNTPYVGLKGL